MVIWKRPKPPFWGRARKQVAQHRITEHDLTPGLRVLERIKQLDRAERARAIAFLQRNGMPYGFSFDAFANNALKLSANLQRDKSAQPPSFAVTDNAQLDLLNALKKLASLERKLEKNKLL
jgi:hypothetical protein